MIWSQDSCNFFVLLLGGAQDRLVSYRSHIYTIRYRINSSLKQNLVCGPYTQQYEEISCILQDTNVYYQLHKIFLIDCILF
jgi:hypothetical protein